MFSQLKQTVAHNPAAASQRCPLGAQPTGGTVELRLQVNSNYVAAVHLELFGEGGLQQSLPMTPQGGDYSVQVCLPDVEGVLWYYFVLHGSDADYYYGANQSAETCFGTLSRSRPAAFQITVYQQDFKTPAWFHKSVMYQIFPDRFAKGEPAQISAGLDYHRQLGRRPQLHEHWQEPVRYQALPGEKYYDPTDFYGGTLRGIQQRLPYLAELGVRVIYLNPVFEAASNHRYDTADYHRIDPILGSNQDFCELCEAAAALDIRILLDGVFSHTGADSVYFDRYGHYADAGSPGAYQSASSPYASWYDIHADHSYRCWWGFEALPEVNEHDPAWQQFMLRAEDSVVRSWLRRGAAGFRLDVADELPDDVLALLRQVVKEENPEAVLLGEVWEDPTNKESYGQYRHYALGPALDSVMNYPLCTALTNFAIGSSSARALATFCIKQRLTYPPPLYHSLMNLLSSHDIARLRTRLATKLDSHTLSREQQASFLISEQQNARGYALQKMLAAVQFALPGVPAIYYGDEQGMQGFDDPFNRAPFVQNEPSLCEWYAALARLRNQNPALQQGAAAFLAPQEDVFAVLRFISNGRDALGEAATNGCFLLVANRSPQIRSAVVDLLATHSGLTQAEQQAFCQTEPRWAKRLIKADEPFFSSAEIAVERGILQLTLPAYSCELWQLL